MDAERRVIDGGAVAVRGTNIDAVGTCAELEPRYPDARRIEASTGLITPGLIDAHNHPIHYLSKGLADDLELSQRSYRHIWPFEAALTDEEARAARRRRRLGGDGQPQRGARAIPPRLGVRGAAGRGRHLQRAVVRLLLPGDAPGGADSGRARRAGPAGRLGADLGQSCGGGGSDGPGKDCAGSCGATWFWSIPVPRALLRR